MAVKKLDKILLLMELVFWWGEVDYKHRSN